MRAAAANGGGCHRYSSDGMRRGSEPPRGASTRSERERERACRVGLCVPWPRAIRGRDADIQLSRLLRKSREKSESRKYLSFPSGSPKALHAAFSTVSADLPFVYGGQSRPPTHLHAKLATHAALHTALDSIPHTFGSSFDPTFIPKLLRFVRSRVRQRR